MNSPIQVIPISWFLAHVCVSTMPGRFSVYFLYREQNFPMQIPLDYMIGPLRNIDFMRDREPHAERILVLATRDVPLLTPFALSPGSWIITK